MSSRLHRGGLTSLAAQWEPPLRNGVRPAGCELPGSPASPVADVSPDVERQIEARAQMAYQRGIKEGESAAREQAAAELQSAFTRMARTTAEVASFKPRLRHEAEEEVVKLAMAISRRILYRELATDPEALRGLVRAALDKLDGREVYRMRANPQDVPVVESCFENMGLPSKIQVFADAGLERGSAIFETAHGSLDASVGMQLNEIERGFADLMRRSP